MLLPFARLFAVSAVVSAAAPFLSSIALAATLTVSPAATHPKGTVTISATGFGANELVDVYFDAVDVALPKTSAARKFTGLQIPLAASVLPGPHWITAVGRTSGTVVQKPLAVRTDWVERRFGKTGRGINPYENLLTPYSVGLLGEAWKVKTNDVVFGAPAVYAGYAYFGTFDGTFRAVSVASGAQKWIQTGLSSVVTTPVVVGNLVVVASGDGKVRAFDAMSGVKKWGPVNIDGSELDASPVVLGTKVYVISINGSLVRLDGKTGTKDWTVAIPNAGGLAGSPTLTADGSQLLVPSDDGTLYARDAATGAAKWSYATGGAIVSQPATVAGRIVFGSLDGKVYCIDETSAFLWSINTGNLIQSSPAVTGSTIFIGNNGNKLLAMDIVAGTTLWTASTLGAVDSSPAYAAGVVYVGANDRLIHAYDAVTGIQLWTGLVGGSVSSASPVVSDGRLFIGGADKTLHAYAIDAGADRSAQAAVRPPDPATLHPRPATPAKP